MTALQQYYSAARNVAARHLITFLLFVGLSSCLVGIVIAIPLGLTAGLSVFFSGIATLALSRILELLQSVESDLAAIRSQLDTVPLRDISTDVSAIRNQMSRGMFGLLGMPK